MVKARLTYSEQQWSPIDDWQCYIHTQEQRRLIADYTATATSEDKPLHHQLYEAWAVDVHNSPAMTSLQLSSNQRRSV